MEKFFCQFDHPTGTGVDTSTRVRSVTASIRAQDGTLGEVVYCITDHPATQDAASPGAGLVAVVPQTLLHGFGAGIRRGVMAADQFTQIANALFRHPGLSFRAKGLFGLLSTHQDGWRMTVADLARRSRDGEAAVKTGLKELEKHGFLVRERDRNPDGTLGAAAYFITDLPSLQNARSRSESGFPPGDNPTLANRPTKKLSGNLLITLRSDVRYSIAVPIGSA
jgi:hypothetical protein